MKRTALMKKLATVGEIRFVRKNGPHDVFEVNGNRFTVPRHKEIGEGLSAEIIAQAQGRRRRK